MSIPWSVVNRTGEAADAVAGKVRAKIAKLEGLLAHFPTDALQLTVILAEQSHRRGYEVAMTLAVPSNVLHAEKRSPSLVRALDETAAVLARQLQRLKARYRHEEDWVRRARRAKLHAQKVAFTESPVAPDGAARTRAEVLRAALETHYPRLLDFAGRHLERLQREAGLPEGALDARDLVDHAAETALRHPGMKSPAMTLDAWLVGLVYHAVRRAARACLREQGRTVPLDLELPRGGRGDAGETGAGDRPLAEELWQEVSRPRALELERQADPRAVSPEHTLEVRNLLETLRGRVAHWPAAWRDLFELHFLEGFDAVEIAMVFGWPVARVEESIRALRDRLWDELVGLAGPRAAPGVPARARRAFAARLDAWTRVARDSQLPAGREKV
jgi:ribosomal subunit interface protein